MAASNNNNAHKPELTLPSSIAQTMRMVQRVAHSATWGERIAQHHQPPSAANFGPGLFRRFDAANAPGQWANDFAQRFVADELPPSSSALPLAPHAPAQRQVSAARQGALSWSGGDRFSSPASSFGGGSIDRFADTNASQSLISDLMGNGWGVQSARPDTLRRFAEPASPEPAPASRSGVAQASPTPAPINRSPAPAAPAQAQPSAPVRRSPESPTSAPAQAPETINRQADVPAAAASQTSSTDSTTPEPSPVSAADDAGPVQRSADSATDTPNAAASTASASEDTAPIETAGTRPMTFFRGTPQSPLMRMGLSESTGSSDAPTGSATINRQPVSGELPVVRPARGSDEPSFSAPTNGAINRQAQQTPTAPGTPSTQVTSSNTIERMASSDAGSGSTASAEIQRTASDSPTTAASESPAAASDTAQPEVQRQAATESSAPSADSTINRSEAAAPTTAADTTFSSTAVPAPVQRSAAPTSGSTSGSADVAAPSASSDSASASESTAAQTASTAGASVIARSTSDAAPAAPMVQRTSAPSESSAAVSADSASDAADTSTADATTPAENPELAATAPAQRTPVVQRKPVQPARAASIDTVLPLANSLMRRYSAGSAQGTSGAMPLLRTFAPTPAAVMRSPAPPTTITGSTLGSSNTPTGASSTNSPSLPPLVHRSPIVPLLPTATLQREPAASATASAATPAPRAATPALEWSALPLLQRISTAHALPATPTASASAPASTSVAAQVINRMAIDQPGATPMPLLRVQAPSIARTASEGAPTSVALMRSPATAAADGSAGISADSPAVQSFTSDDSGAASFNEQAAPASVGFGGQSVSTIHRSAILPSLSSTAFQPLTLLRMHVPDAPSTAQADAPAGSLPLQRSPDAPSSTAPLTSPIMMRAAEQPSISVLASANGDRTGNSLKSASGVASPSLPPLVHRSPIVPLLPTATLQREPAASATASAATPAPRAATPALEWSALPLLQRISTAHALPATPTASASAPASTSVAAQVINRMAIDQPGATPMPLLRMHTPTQAPLLSREADPEVAASADGSAPGSASESAAAQPSLMSSMVRRSPILASAPSFASQAGNVGSMAAPAAETSSGVAQRSPAADYALPMLQRTSVQRFFGSRPGLKLPSLGGIQNSVNSLAGQAQGMVGQVTNMPGQLMGQAQGMVNQVTGMPNQLMGQAQGMLDQVTGMPNQLMGQAQGMLDQVTGMPNQLMGQAQGMLDQVTGMPNQLMGQAQGMLDQVTGMPNQLMGQAQGMLDQVTGLPNQLMGQAQGMMNQVTGLPNQLMGQAQGMMNQVTELPNQLMGQAQGMMNQVTELPNQLMGQAQGMLDQVTGMPGQLMGQGQGMLDQAGGLPGQMQDAASNLLGARSSQLTLLRPVRTESQSAPVRDTDDAQGEAATGSSGQAAAGGAGGAGGAGKQASGEGGKQGKPDIDMLAQQVYARLRHRLLIDRERLGH